MANNSRIALAIVATLLLSSSLLAQDTGAACAHVIRGSVVNDDVDTSLVNLQVALYNSQGMSELIRADDKGNFEASIACDQFYQLLVHADGLRPYRELIPSCALYWIDYHRSISLTNSPWIAICGNK